MKAYIEHVAVCVKDISWSEKFFKEALNMEETRRAFNNDGTIKSIWFRNGLQLLSAGSKQAHHLGLVVDNYEEAKKRMLSFDGVEHIKGKPEKWFQLPDGIVIELFQAKPNAIDSILSINIK